MKCLLLLTTLLIQSFCFSQSRVAVIGSSTAAGLAASTPDSGWVGRFNIYYKRTLGVADTVYNLGFSSTNLYHGMPSTYSPPPGRPAPDVVHNVSRAVSLLSDLPVPANGVVIINYPSGGYDTYTIPEIMTALQVLFDSATRQGNRAYVTTTQPRTDAGFNTSAVKRKLAVLKDSIINRFGIARTINFWDGMYNPVDTTILPAYATGDNVHFNNLGHRVLFERVRAKNILNQPLVTYRSNVASTGLWNDPANWQVLSGSVWVTATMPPSSGSGPITILSGDSIRINSYTELDQVTIESGGVLTMFNTNTPVEKITVALNDGTGDDIINNGRLYISANCTLNGTGTVRNTSGGLFTLRNRGVLETNAINEGILYISGTGIVRSRTVTNNRICVLQDFTLNLIGSTFINNDSMAVIGGGSTFIADSTLTGGVFRNAVTGIVHRTQSTGSTLFSPSIALTNNGTFKGIGEYAFDNMPVNSGTISPGSSPGILTVSPLAVNGKTPLIEIEISSTGNVAGTNYDQVVLSSRGTTSKNITGARLRVTDRAADPVGTQYTILTTPTGTITGPFASVTLSPSLSGPFYNGTTVTVTKTSVLPVNWGPFTAIADGHTVVLSWRTLQESNTSHFVTEHSVDGVTYNALFTLNAAGESSSPVDYTYTHLMPDANGINYYRIRQADRNGTETFSAIRTVRLSNGPAADISFVPNPFRDYLSLQLKVPASIVIYSQQGLPVHTAKFGKGTHHISLKQLPSGSYVLTAIDSRGERKSWSIVKL